MGGNLRNSHLLTAKKILLIPTRKKGNFIVFSEIKKLIIERTFRRERRGGEGGGR